MVNVIIDDIPVSVPRNTTVLQACDTVGIDVPRFCFHERLLIAGNCRMCLVEIEKSPKPVASCTLPVMEGMKVYTRTPLVKKAQESVLEFLLLNHPLDCPICDQGGECDLQDQSVAFGSDSGRFYEYKRGVEDKNCGPLVKTIMTRCIHCTRCVRFATEIAGISDLGTTGRGRKTEIGTYVQKLIKSELSGNIIDLCPVGALTSKPYAFRGRSWELKSTESIDINDGLGSNIIINTKGNEVLRILPRFNESLNEEWISNKARFSYDALRTNRLSSITYNQDRCFLKNKGLKFSSELSIFDVIKASTSLNFKKDEVTFISGEVTDMETLLVAKDLANSLGSSLYSTNKYSQSSDFNNNLDFSTNYKLITGLASVEDHDLCILVNINPRYEAPLLNTRLRKRVITNNMEVCYIGDPLDLSFKSTNLGLSNKTLVSILEGRHPICSQILKSKNPLFIFGNKTTSFDLKKVKDLLISNVHLNNKVKCNFLNNNISDTGSSELGIKTVSKEDLSNKRLVFLLNTNNRTFNISEFISLDAFIVYIGTHGDYINDVNVSIPSCSYAEKSSSYMNTEGRIQKTRKALSGPFPQEDWKFFDLISSCLGQDLPFKSLKDLHLFYKDQFIKEFVKTQTIPQKITISQTSYIENSLSNLGVEKYYSTGILTDNSKIMSQCCDERGQLNF